MSSSFRSENTKRVSAFLRGGGIYLQATSETTAGVWIGTGPVAVIDRQAEGLGLAILTSLGFSISPVRHPGQKEWQAVQAPLLDAADVKTWLTFAKHAKQVGISQSGSEIKLEPSSFQADRSWFKPIVEREMKCACDEHSLAAGLIAAFDRSTGHEDLH